MGGNGRLWSVPVSDDFLDDDDPVPVDGEPYPEHGPIPLGPHPLPPNWQQEMNGAASNLGFFGGNPHLNPAHPILLDEPVNMEIVPEAATQNQDIQIDA